MLAVSSAAAVAVMLALWLLGIRHRNFSYVDMGWSANFVLLALILGGMSGGDTLRRLLLCGMFAVWGARLTAHLAGRIVGKSEEGRYVELRRRWGGSGNLNLKFLVFFQFQAALNVLLVLPMLLAVSNPASRLSVWEIAGALVWAIGLAGETIADAQLRRFKLDPRNRGRVCDTGLWGWSRHPNYFFEWIVWVGYALFALASPYGWICLALPALMLHFLLNVTGVKPTEEQALRSKGDAYRQYQRRVSAFVPLPPRERSL